MARRIIPVLVGFAIVAALANPADCADPGAVGGIVAGAAFVAGPKSGTKDFAYLKIYDDQNKNGYWDPEEPLWGEYRLDTSSFTFWSTSRYARGLVDKDALRTYLNAFRTDTRSLNVSPMEGMSSSGLRGNPMIHFADNQIPVIVLSSNPDAVLEGMNQLAKGVKLQEDLVTAMGSQGPLRRVRQESETVSRELTESRQKQNQLAKEVQDGKEWIDRARHTYPTTTTYAVSYLMASKGMADFLHEVDNQTSATRIQKAKDYQKKTDDICANEMAPLLQLLGHDLRNLSPSQIRSLAEKEVKEK